MYLLDTNILLRWSDADSPTHQLCKDAIGLLADSGNQLRICTQIAIEYWVTATRPVDVNGFGLSLLEADKNLADITAAFSCLPEPAVIFDIWRSLIVHYGVIGKQAHDARIAALMLAYGVTHILTLNPVDFNRYPNITPVTPQEILLQ